MFHQYSLQKMRYPRKIDKEGDSSKISQFVERFLMENIGMNVSSDSKLQIGSISSIGIFSILEVIAKIAKCSTLAKSMMRRKWNGSTQRKMKTNNQNEKKRDLLLQRKNAKKKLNGFRYSFEESSDLSMKVFQQIFNPEVKSKIFVWLP